MKLTGSTALSVEPPNKPSIITNISIIDLYIFVRYKSTMSRTPTLTDKQKKFAELLVYNEGRKSPAECANEAGYTTRPRQSASELKNPKIYPLVSKYIGELRAEVQEKYGITFEKHITELAKIRDEARSKGQNSAAINAEVARGKAGGLYIDQKLNYDRQLRQSYLKMK